MTSEDQQQLVSQIDRKYRNRNRFHLIQGIIAIAAIISFLVYWQLTFNTPQINAIDAVADSLGKIACKELGMRFTVRVPFSYVIGDKMHWHVVVDFSAKDKYAAFDTSDVESKILGIIGILDKYSPEYFAFVYNEKTSWFSSTTVSHRYHTDRVKEFKAIRTNKAP